MLNMAIKFTVTRPLAPILTGYLTQDPLPTQKTYTRWLLDLQQWCHVTHGGHPTRNQVTQCLLHDIGYRRITTGNQVNYVKIREY